MVVETELYDTLGISPTSSSTDIKKAFRKLALKHHPDKGGDAEIFKKINAAYEILKDNDKRRNYDQFGKNGLKGQINDDILTSLFGDIFTKNTGGLFGGFGHMFNMAHQAITKTKPVIHRYMVSLEDICQSKVKRLKFPRERICKCSLNNIPKKCNECKGRGVRIQVRRAGSMIIQQQVKCICNNGKVYSSCSNCTNGIYIDEKIFSIKLNPNVKHGSQILFKGDGNQNQGLEPGDFIVIVNYKPHKLYKIDNQSNLYHNINITLKEALCGGHINLLHPNGKELALNFINITPGKELSFPYGIIENSKLNIKFSIIFPKLNNEEKNKLKNILP